MLTRLERGKSGERGKRNFSKVLQERFSQNDTDFSIFYSYRDYFKGRDFNLFLNNRCSPASRLYPRFDNLVSCRNVLGIDMDVV